MPPHADESDHDVPSMKIHVSLEDGPLSARKHASELAAGGECVFLGRTRPEEHLVHGSLKALDYEAHPSLAAAALERIAVELVRTHDLEYLSIRHSTGAVPVGAICVEIIAAARHRDAAFVACREAIDRLKAEAPIWKQECWSDGRTWSPSSRPIHAPERTT
ncbi:MAG: molybdenum cofactor biosynthesis protein MoaE [Planctomycetota bacterium]|jgi:molybdopterin synthase catalytic subunit|nr:molybdenum cofactor biosynthesis protein MoaE [Planctomycetota bacterium]MDA1025662.1 molybdenum cofactor biosynthesis protein MoaE [Planctomycetota bacterium]